jgi:hypothetical protein
MVILDMALLSFKESTPGAYGLKASNAALPISTSIHPPGLEPVGYGRSFTNKYDGIGIAGSGCGAPMQRLQQMIIAHGGRAPASSFAFASGYSNLNATTETRVN